MKVVILAFSFLFIFIQINAQLFIPLDVPVFENGHQLVNPWVGGMNAPQWSQFDINDDGKKDLYAFDRNGNVHLSFINMDESPGATSYHFSRNWLANFPDGQDYVLMRDFNHDGATDMFVSAFAEGRFGFKVYKGFFQNGYLHFDRVEFPDFDHDIIPFYVNGQVVDLIEVNNNQDYPAIDDIDGDGDFDILTMNGDGSNVLFFKNIALESGLTDDVLMFEFADDCWGRFGILPFSEKLILSTESTVCAFFRKPDTENDRVHGGSAICTFDNDDDGDKELLISDLIFPSVIFAENGGDEDNAWMVSQDTMFPSNNAPVDIPDFPAPYFLDVNNDGAHDLLFSPNQALNTPDVETAWWYENNGTDQHPDFHFKQRDFIAETMLDFGTGAHPTFVDVNADGLLDIVIGNREEWDSTSIKSYLVLLLNIGTETNPEFEVIDRDWLGLKQYNAEIWAFAPAFGDLDDDGDEDLLVGDRQGFINYFENIAGEGAPMQFDPPQFRWNNINVGAHATPFIYDINNDGLQDLLIGERQGTVNYFPNIGSTGNPAFHPTEEEAPNNNYFGRINTQPENSSIGFSEPIVLAFNDASYVVTGTVEGWLQRYKINPDSLENGTFELINERLGHWREGIVSRIAFANINSSNNLDAIIGNDRGGVSLFQSPITVDGIVNDHEVIAEKNNDIIIYPNPTNQEIFIDWKNIKTNGSFDFEIINSFGQTVLFGKKQINEKIEIHVLPDGIYFLQLRINEQKLNKLFIKQ